MATRKGLEPSTSSVTGWHSNQSELPGRAWWAFRDSNPGPTGYEPVALPTELKAQKCATTNNNIQQMNKPVKRQKTQVTKILLPAICNVKKILHSCHPERSEVPCVRKSCFMCCAPNFNENTRLIYYNIIHKKY